MEPEISTPGGGVEDDVATSTANTASDSLLCNRAQFWGAVGILVEKPHILNRRLCGVADLWWGVAKLHKSSTFSLNKVALSGNDSAIPSQLNESCSSDGSVRKDNIEDKNYSSSKNTESLVEIVTDSIEKQVNSSDSNVLRQINIDNSDTTQVETNIEINQRTLSKSATDISTTRSLAETLSLTLKKLQQIEANTNATDCVSDAASLSNDVWLPDLTSLLRSGGFEEVCTEEGRRFQPWASLTQQCSDVFAVVRRALPKQAARFRTTIEVIFLDGGSDCCSVLSTSSSTGAALLPCFPYHLSHRQGAFSLTADIASCKGVHLQGVGAPQPAELGNPGAPADNTNTRNTSGDPSGLQWLHDTVLPRVAKWATQISENGQTTGGSGSLARVDLQAYSALYQALKLKYAATLVQSWQERTDPHKFVHEDIGIATYLLLVWSRYSDGRPQRFLDLGCGNGLLVYILTAEGHVGQGLDIKKRNIWDTFPSGVDLQEREVRPCDSSLDPRVDWLLGNHSDELTPWIPVMAARTSYTCSFFVLPCCPHDFTAKFLRRNSGVSQYSDYLDYVEEVGSMCGFVMERDRLKIPSTKRVCFVGHDRNYSVEEWPRVLDSVQHFIDQRVQLYASIRQRQAAAGSEASEQSLQVTNTDHPGPNVDNQAIVGVDQKGCPATVGLRDDPSVLWGEGFVARAKEQRTRNCTQLKQEVKDDLTRAVVAVILGDHKLLPPEWQSGAPTALREVAAALGARRLQQLKQECGGLQTLLRNHRHIFLVHRGTVSLRTPGQVSEDSMRRRACWFYTNHPQGCPNPSNTCIYEHSGAAVAV